MLLGAEPGKLHVILNHLNDSVCMFVSAKCSMLIQDCTGPKLNLVRGEEELNNVDKFEYFGSYFYTDGLILAELPSRIRKTIGVY